MPVGELSTFTCLSYFLYSSRRHEFVYFSVLLHGVRLLNFKRSLMTFNLISWIDRFDCFEIELYVCSVAGL